MSTAELGNSLLRGGEVIYSESENLSWESLLVRERKGSISKENRKGKKNQRTAKAGIKVG